MQPWLEGAQLVFMAEVRYTRCSSVTLQLTGQQKSESVGSQLDHEMFKVKTKPVGGDTQLAGLHNPAWVQPVNYLL